MHFPSMSIDMNKLHEDMLKIQRDLDLIKHILTSEGKLTDWAKAELKKAREEDESSYTNLEEL